MRLLRSLLYGLSDRDRSVYGSTILVAVVVTLLACCLPAARTDPAVALPEEG